MAEVRHRRRTHRPVLGSRQQAEALYGPIVTKVVGAAYAAVHSGVSLALIVAGGVILASGIVAYFTFTPDRLEQEPDAAADPGDTRGPEGFRSAVESES